MSEAAGGAVVRLRVRPRAGSDAVAGVAGGRLRVTVRAAPERGRANAAALAVLARALGVPASDLELVSGRAGRDKLVAVRGLDAQTVRARLGIS